MTVLDIHTWAGGNDDGWVNSPQGIVTVVHNEKVFGQFEVPGQWDKVGHYRDHAIPFAPNQVFSQVMAATEDTFTDFCFGIRPNGSFTINGCAGVYFAAYQNNAFEAFLWDQNTNQSSAIRIPILKNKDYMVKIVTMENGYIEAFVGNDSLGVSVNQGSGGAPAGFYGMLAFGQCGNGTGVAVIDNYKVVQR